jgi:predicted nucleotide-binding protein (sugar kinase/HSP70/actin superfamily)
MGSLSVALKAGFGELGMGMAMPPPTTKRTLSLGVRHSPETVCLPFKVTLGNFIEALEGGADTLIMPAGRGLCRFGYYSKLHEQILRQLGYDFQMVTVDLFGGKIFSVFRLFQDLSGASMPKVISAVRFGLRKLGAMDDVERLVHRVRPVELEKGTTTRLFKEATAAIDEAGDNSSLKRAKREYIQKLKEVPTDLNAVPLKVGLIGEFYVLLEPFVNMDVEIELGKLGVEVRRSTFISEWTKFSLFLNAFGLSEKSKLHRAANPYLRRDVGGDGWETVGHKVLDAEHYEGLVHLAPFTCMPETVALNILPSIREDIPVLSIIYDEQMGKAGMLTRLEAFVDLLRRRRGRKTRVSAKRGRDEALSWH